MHEVSMSLKAVHQLSAENVYTILLQCFNSAVVTICEFGTDYKCFDSRTIDLQFPFH